jgi:hypothetical protein
MFYASPAHINKGVVYRLEFRCACYLIVEPFTPPGVAMLLKLLGAFCPFRA